MFAKRFARLLEESGLRNNELAAMLGVSEALISRFLKGDRRPSYEVLVKIADVFNCSTDYLLGRVNTPWGHVLTRKEKLSFLPEPLVDELEIRINGKEVTLPIKRKILQVIREKGLI